MIETLHRIIEGISTAISLTGVLVVLWGVAQALATFVGSKVGPGQTRLFENVTVRQELGSHLLLGLEIFISADIISSVASPTWNKVGLLAAIVGIRTVLSYFLTLEMKTDSVSGRS
ncbi:MAG: DUF1622 domain-containing protein [bacterium]|nr:DUF1622 domain-containing protein [bacterium]MDT8396405.1 DUF1622 domain-containing protein [bacterium]